MTSFIVGFVIGALTALGVGGANYLKLRKGYLVAREELEILRNRLGV